MAEHDEFVGASSVGGGNSFSSKGAASPFRGGDEQERLLEALRAGRVVGFEWDLASDTVVRSANADEVFGPDATRDTGEGFFSRVHAEDREAMSQALGSLTPAKADYSATFRYVRPSDGKELVVEDQGRAEFDGAGKRVRVRGLARDVTEQRRAEAELRRGKELGEAVSRISQVVHSTLEPGEVIQRIVEEGAQALGSETAAISEREGNGWRVRYVRGMPAEMVGLRLEDEQERHAVLALETRAVVAVGDAVGDGFGDERFNREHLRRHHVRSVLVAPILIQGRPFGVIFFNYHQGRHAFTESELNFARQLAASAASALGNARLFEERKRAEAAVRESEERYRSMFETLIEGFCTVEVIFDEQGKAVDYRFLEVNPAFEGQTGLYDARGKLMRELAPEHEAHWFEIYGRVALTGEAVHFENEAKALGRYYDVCAYRVGRPEERRVAILFNDITQRKRAEAALREGESRAKVAETIGRERQRFYDVLNKLPAYVVLLSPDYHVPFANRFFEERFGKSNGRRCYEYLFSRREPCENCETYKVLKTNAPQDWEWTGPDGRNYEVHDFPFTDADGTEMIMEMGIDVTERKRAEAALKEANQSLAERSAKLQELVGELEHFSYTITHDMRAPLRGMQGFAEMMAEACEGCEREDPAGFLRRIRTSATRMDALITDALDYNKAVRQELPLAPVDLRALLRGMLDSYPELQPARADIAIVGEIPLVMGNEAGLTQCFSNLLGNAVKFVKRGEKADIRIWAECRQEPGAGSQEPGGIGVGAEGEWVRVWVEDQGIGIPKLLLPRVFEMFSRGHNSYEGTGIGLALVRKVVERMGGKVGVESADGRGSRFWVELKPGEVRVRK